MTTLTGSVPASAGAALLRLRRVLCQRLEIAAAATLVLPQHDPG